MEDTTQSMKHEKPFTLRRKANETRQYGNFGMGWFGVGLGALLALCFGIPLSLVLAGYGTEFKRWSLIPLWIVFLPGGLGLIAYSVRNILRAKNAAVTISEDGKHPWDWDHDWKKEQQANQFWKRTIRHGLGGLFVGFILLAFMLPGLANLDKFQSNGEGGGMAVIGVCAVFGGFWLLCLGVGLAQIPVDYILKDFSIRYARIPYFVGGKVHIQVSLPEKIVEQIRKKKAMSMQARLRLIEEAAVTEKRKTLEDGHRRTKKTTTVKNFQCWEQAIQIDNLCLVADEKGKVVLSWDLPENLEGNDLTGAFTRTWQLMIKMKYGAFPVKHHYLVPIYDRSGRRSAE